MKAIRVLVIDDSALVREILSKGLSRDPQIEVVGTANDPYMAREKIAKLRPDLLTLDVEMPRMDGVQFLRHLMPQFPLPVVMVSALTGKGQQMTLDALDAGAVDFVTKPQSNIAEGLEGMLEELRFKVKMAFTADLSQWKTPSSPKKLLQTSEASKALSRSTDKVMAIGASTGGVEAIRALIAGLPVASPGIVICQHMPPGFTTSFAERLNDISALSVKEAESGDRILPGRVLLAPGDKHLRVIRSGGNYLALCESGDLVNRHCPSVDVLFHSVAKYVGANAIGVLLTGMGADGALGLLEIKKSGGKTLGQNEKSSVVFGMAKQAHKVGAVDRLVSLAEMPAVLITVINEMHSKK